MASTTTKMVMALYRLLIKVVRMMNMPMNTAEMLQFHLLSPIPERPIPLLPLAMMPSGAVAA